MSAPCFELIESDEDSIVELFPPTKPPPIVVDVDIEDEIVLNITSTPVIFATPTKPVSIIVRKETPSKQHGKDSGGCGEDPVSPYHWTNDMKTFYNDDYACEENFVLDELLCKMSRDRKFWNVARQRMPSSRAVACFKCNLHHKSKNCRSSSCHMCGIEGHLAARCPHRMCLTCGKRALSYVACCRFCSRNLKTQCRRCSVYGHSVMDCTDNWRRFHNTTCKGNIEAPNRQVLKPLHQIWCCNCGRQGHLEVDCVHTRCDFHSPSSTLVASYESSFNVDKAGGLDFHKRKNRNEPNNFLEIPNLVQKPTNNEIKRKRYFVMPPEDDDFRTKRLKRNDGVAISTSSSAVSVAAVLHNKPSATFKRPTEPQRVPPASNSFMPNIQNSNDEVATSTINYAMYTGEVLYHRPAALSSSSTAPERVHSVENTFRFKKQSNSHVVVTKSNNPVVSVDEVIYDGPSTSFASHTASERIIFNADNRKSVITPEPAFIPLESKKKKKRKPRNKKNKANNTEPKTKSIKKTLIEANKVFKKKDKRVSKFFERRWKQHDRRMQSSHLNQNQQPSIPSAAQPLMGLPFHRSRGPSYKQRPVESQRGAIQSWNSFLLGV